MNKDEEPWSQGDSILRCDTCHDDPTFKGESKLPPEQKKRNLKRVFHKRCQGCHREVRRKNRGTKAPVSCRKCHAAKPQDMKLTVEELKLWLEKAEKAGNRSPESSK